MLSPVPSLPDKLPILPLSNKVLLPSITTNFMLSDAEVKPTIAGDYVVCVPLKGDGTYDDLSQLHHFGCTAKILKIDRTLPGTAVVHVQGICRSHIKDILYEGSPMLEASLIHHYCIAGDDDGASASVLSSAAAQFRLLCKEYVTRMRDVLGIPDAVLSPLAQSLTQGAIPDIISLVVCLTETTYQDKLRVLDTLDIQKLLELGIRAVSCHLQTLQESTELQQSVEQTLDRHRREFYLRNQFHRIERNNSNYNNSDAFVTQQQQQQQQQQQNIAYLSAKATNNNNNNNNNNKLALRSNSSNTTSMITPSSEDDEELADLVHHLNRANLPSYAQSVVYRDVKRLRKLMPSTPESGILRSYLELVAALPWQQQSTKKTSGSITGEEDVSISVAQKHLDADHYGLAPVKRRILEYLSVIKVKKDLSPPILCLVGPPGVGKTTLARSIATALNRKFYRMSLGSIRDEADIRGHRRTYVAAMPGLLINGMRKCGVKNPVILLDEIDKVVQNSSQGDPAAAMLEVLDPSQNASFMDHFLNIPFDLSQVLFIATANSMETISGPLLDRMEVVNLSGYTTDEKMHIARSYLWPKQLEAHGLDKSNISLTDKALLYVIEHYTQESGVRNLDRNIASLCRYKCKEYADLVEAAAASRCKKSSSSIQFKTIIDIDDVHTILGAPIYAFDVVDNEEAVPGVVSGLAYSQGGMGGILAIEVNQMPGRGKLILTGSLGDVLKESAYIAVSWIKANAYALGLTASRKEELLADMDLHIHVPDGAVRKDGPSAGITMVMSIISLLSGKPVPKTTAMTGEITLRGQIRAIGGVKEKVVSAHRAGIERILLPAINQRDVLQDVPEHIRQSIKFVYCKSLWDGVEAVFDMDGSTTVTKCSARYASHL